MLGAARQLAQADEVLDPPETHKAEHGSAPLPDCGTVETNYGTVDIHLWYCRTVGLERHCYYSL